MTSAGTPLATERSVPQPDAVWRTQRNRFFLNDARGTTRSMLAAGMLVQSSMVGILIHAGYPSWRIAAMIGVYLAFLVAHRLIIGRTRDPQGVEASFIYMNLTAQLFIV